MFWAMMIPGKMEGNEYNLMMDQKEGVKVQSESMVTSDFTIYKTG
jgi:hypothetical protein